MTKRWIAAVAAAVLLPAGLPAPAAAQEPTPEQIVSQFFPQRLIEESEDDHAAGGPLPFMASDFAVVDLEGGGELIVAAYTNGFSGAVRALRRVGADWQLADEPDLPRLGGVFPAVSPLELDADGTPEVLVSLSSARGPSADWVFDWTGTELVPVNPTVADDAGEIDTVLSDADFVDLDGDGVLEMLNPTGSGPVAADETEPIGFGDYDVYAFDGDRFVPAGEVVHFGTATRAAGPPVTERIGFSVQATGAYLLHIVNGTQAGADRVSSAVIRLNGVQVAGPSDFNQNVAELDLEVSLQQENRLEIELRGRPGGRLAYTFEPAS